MTNTAEIVILTHNNKIKGENAAHFTNYFIAESYTDMAAFFLGVLSLQGDLLFHPVQPFPSRLDVFVIIPFPNQHL